MHRVHLGLILAGNGYRARSAEPFGLCADGETRDEALKNLRQALVGRLAAGAEILPLERSFDSISAVESSEACINERAALARL